MTAVKVCGLRELPHVLAAAEAGADLLGMVFVPGVRRFLPPERAQALVLGFRESHPINRRATAGTGAGHILVENKEPSVIEGAQQRPGVKGRALVGAGHALPLVGLFADQPAAEVNRVAGLVGLDAVQLCGEEPPEHWEQVRYPILKVVHVPAIAEGEGAARRAAIAALEERLRQVAEAGHLAVLDRGSEGQPGGLGRAFDWTIARELADRGHRFLLAGGLTPENVGGAIATVSPYGVDVSSGVETDGVKDPSKIRAFVAAARERATRV